MMLLFLRFNHQTVYRLIFDDYYFDKDTEPFQSPNGVQIDFTNVPKKHIYSQFQSPNGVQIDLTWKYGYTTAIPFQSPNGVQIDLAKKYKKMYICTSDFLYYTSFN